MTDARFIDKWTPVEIDLFQRLFHDWRGSDRSGRVGDFDAAVAQRLNCSRASIRKLRAHLHLAAVTVQ